MTNLRFLAAVLLALPLAAAAQTKPAPQQVTEVTEDLDPATGKVIRRTTRTYTLPAGTPAAAAKVAVPAATATAPAVPTPTADGRATNTQVSDFFREKISVSTLTAPALVETYTLFIDKVRGDRHGWKSSDWTAAAAVLSSLNARYDQLRPNLSLDDKVTVRSMQAEFQALRTARQLSDQVSDKL